MSTLLFIYCYRMNNRLKILFEFIKFSNILILQLLNIYAFIDINLKTIISKKNITFDGTNENFKTVQYKTVKILLL